MRFKVKWTVTSVYEADCIASSPDDAETKLLQGDCYNIKHVKDLTSHENIEIEKN